MAKRDGGPGRNADQRTAPSSTAIGAAVAALVLLLAVVAVSARPLSPGIIQPAGELFNPRTHERLVRFALMAVCAALIVAWTLLHRRPPADRDGSRARPLFRLAVIASLVFLALLLVDAAIVALIPTPVTTSSATPPNLPLSTPTPLAVTPPTPVPSAQPALVGSSSLTLGTMGWLKPVLALLALALAGAMLLLARSSRHVERAATIAAPPEPALEEALDEGVDALARESDPRRAVIAAYVAMERSLTRAGQPRRRHEAPFEYLRRILPAARVDGQTVYRLADLFEQARFSAHAIGPDMRESALQALRALQGELAAAEETTAGKG